MIVIKNLMYISWNVSPSLYDGFISVRYYSIFFAFAFIIGYQLVKKMYLAEKAPLEWMDKLLVYTVVGTIIGARLGHVFFYDWNYYSKNVAEIFMIWKGGLASHGAAIALIFTMWIYSKKITFKSTLWSLDKLVIVVALAAGFIRIGNLMNSEIVGKRTADKSGIFYENKASNTIANFFSIENSKVDFIKTGNDTIIDNFIYPMVNVKIPLGQNTMKPVYANVFANSFNIENQDTEADFFSGEFSNKYKISSNNDLLLPIYIIPRIPTQLWEALSYWIIFIFLFWGYWKKKWNLYEGRLFGLFLILLFTSRLIVEFFKEHQTLSEKSFLSMGQYLSIPLIFIGLYFLIKSKKVDSH